MLISLAIPTNITYWNAFVSCSFTFLVVALATTVSTLVDEGTVGKIKVQHSWKKQLSCSGSVDEGPTKNSEPMFI